MIKISLQITHIAKKVIRILKPTRYKKCSRYSIRSYL